MRSGIAPEDVADSAICRSLHIYACPLGGICNANPASCRHPVWQAQLLGHMQCFANSSKHAIEAGMLTTWASMSMGLVMLRNSCGGSV
eukprot:1160252-Pelagomonas_calceolata.AAC.13